MPSTPSDLDRAFARTLSHDDRAARHFWDGARDHEVSQNVAAFLQRSEAPPPLESLDLGCGPGRDLATFTALGHRATGLEGSAPMAALARAHSGCRVLEQNFLALALPPDHFDGVFANAALFHVLRQALPRVLRELHATLEAGGVLLSSNPRGNGEEGMNGDRYGAYHDWIRGADS